MTKKIIIIAGPTASGKTALSVELARMFRTVVISADSRQCYKEMMIGTAVPSAEEMQGIPHYFIHSHSIHEPVSAGKFAEYALQKLDELFQSHDIVILTGGTGLYIQALTEGLHELPDVPEDIRARINTKYAEEGIAYLQKYLAAHDPEYYKKVDQQNPARLLRAVELIEHSGIKYSELLARKKESPLNYELEKYAIDIRRDALYERIDQRVDRMLNMGLIDEVKSLMNFRSLPPLQTVGYTEIFDYLDGKCSLEFAIDKIKQHTRNYAKRQLTWFRNRGQYLFLPPEEILSNVQKSNTKY